MDAFDLPDVQLERLPCAGLANAGSVVARSKTGATGGSSVIRRLREALAHDVDAVSEAVSPHWLGEAKGMSTQEKTTGARPGAQPNTPKVMVVAALVAVLFFFGLLIFERIPEIPVDIDFKPFFIAFLFLALLPRGLPTFAIPLGAAVGEAIGDIIEGYEVDDPFGFAGYFLGFALAGYLMGGKPLNWVRVGFACIAGSLVQAVIEASAFLAFGEEGVGVTLYSAAGNTVTHGLLMGAVVTVPLVFALHGRIERLLGFTPLPK